MFSLHRNFSNLLIGGILVLISQTVWADNKTKDTCSAQQKSLPHHTESCKATAPTVNIMAEGGLVSVTCDGQKVSQVFLRPAQCYTVVGKMFTIYYK
jgi:hypothetical protein